MSSFDAWDPAANSGVSYRISEILDNSVGRAIQQARGRAGVAEQHGRAIALAVTNGLHSSIDSAINHEVNGRQFRNWDTALSILTKEVQDNPQDELSPHRHHFILPQARQGDPDEHWKQIVGHLGSEPIALLTTACGPRPPQRPGY